MMSEQSLISVIVPVYNVEKYLRPCVESILEQTYKNIEVILVNDGSTDKSKAICLELAEKDKRISYYEKANSGLSDTRNVGLEKAKGEYIAFVDSDDLLAPNAVRTLYELCRKYDTGIAVGKISHFVDGEQPYYKTQTRENVFGKDEAICNFLYAPCILYDLDGYYTGLRMLLSHMIETGLSSEERQKGICFAKDLAEIKTILNR